MSNMTSNTGVSQYFFRLNRKRTNSLRKPIAASLEALIWIKGVAVIEHKVRVLPLFVQYAIADHQHFDLSAHQATECIFRCVSDRLAAHVETRVDQYRTARFFFKRAKRP